MAVKSHKLGPGSLTFGETGTLVEFNTRTRTVTLEPEYDEGDSIPVLSGDELQEDGSETFNLTGTILQDYDVDSLLVWAHVHSGQTVPFNFIPDNDKGLKVTGEVRVRRIAIGGEAKERAESDFEFPGVGMYELVNAADETVLTWTETTESTTEDSPAVDPVDWH